LLCFIYSLSFNFSYLAYIGVLTIFMVIIGGYVAIFREQKKLIDEVRSIEASDRIQPRLKEEES
jgi:cbb3-type cytochrome oxidase subunit 3